MDEDLFSPSPLVIILLNVCLLLLTKFSLLIETFIYFIHIFVQIPAEGFLNTD